MTRTLYLAWRYLSYHRVKTAILVGSITLIVFLPVGLRVLVKQSSEQLTARAVATPLVVGAKGSPLELVLNTLYFGSDSPELLRYREVQRVEESGLARAIPMDVRFNARGHPIVGTTLDYFAFRDTRVAGGRLFAILGECVVGARVAEALEVGPGDDVISSPESVFDLAGVYPLKMRIAGVLEFSDSADDDAIFVDVKTSWVIEGRVHGHQDLAAPEAARGVLSRDGNRVTANASVVQYNEITPDNVDSFHFHGDLADYPVTAVVVVPPDQKSSALLQGRYEGAEETAQIVRPDTVMGDLLATILTVETFVIAGAVIVGIATLASASLVFMLSLRLRRREIETLFKIGGSRPVIAAVMASEVAVVLLAGVLLAAVLTLLTSQFGSTIIRALVRM
jgi:putative ABC transport system permease protein